MSSLDVRTKVTQTRVTYAQLATAYGGWSPDESPVTVECPVEYRAGRITAADIVHDRAIRVLDHEQEAA